MLISRTARIWTGLAGAGLALSVLAACGHLPGTAPQPQSSASGSAAPGGPSAPAPSPSDTTPATPPVAFSANVADGAKDIKVDTVVTAKATGGTLSKVTLAYTMKDRKGKTVKGTVPGKLAKDKSSWTAGDRLEPAATYVLTTTGVNSVQATSQQSTTFKSQPLTLAQQTYPTIYPLPGSTVGVGMPVIITFDVPVKNRAAFEKQLTVKTVPAQKGSWHWFSSKEVHFRPKTYWKAGTKVTVNATLNGVNAGGGIYGQNSTKTSFTVGRSLVTKINLASDVAHVYRNGKLVRTIYVSGGKPGWQTRSGTKLILDKLPVTRMTNAMIGAKEEYDLQVKWAMRITWSGEFIHAAPWNAANFGRRNASHGCVGMSTADAGWLFSQVLIGDPVVTTGTSRGIESGNGWTDWNVPWATYKKGSAL